MELAAQKRLAVILAIGCAVIIVGVGLVLHRPSAAVGGCIGWGIAMVWSARRDRASNGRR